MSRLTATWATVAVSAALGLGPVPAPAAAAAPTPTWKTYVDGVLVNSSDAPRSSRQAPSPTLVPGHSVTVVAMFVSGVPSNPVTDTVLDSAVPSSSPSLPAGVGITVSGVTCSPGGGAVHSFCAAPFPTSAAPSMSAPSAVAPTVPARTGTPTAAAATAPAAATATAPAVVAPNAPEGPATLTTASAHSATARMTALLFVAFLVLAAVIGAAWNHRRRRAGRATGPAAVEQPPAPGNRP